MISTGSDTGSAADTFPGRVKNFVTGTDQIRIMAPEAVQRTSLEEKCRSDAWSVFCAEPLHTSQHTQRIFFHKT